MEQVVITATRREGVGKGPARQARRDGRVPGVAYGLHRPPIALSVSRDDLERLLAHHRGSVLVRLEIDGQAPEPNTAALIKQVQRHPVSRVAESVDFQWVALEEEVTVTVPVVVEGQARGVVEGGVINQLLHEVEITCRPLEIPEAVTINVDGLGMHETRTVADLQLPAGVTALADPDTPVVTCTPPSPEELPEPESPVEGELTSLEET